MVVETVFAQSAAEKAGLKKGDRILTIDGRWTDTLADVVIATSLIKAGKTVEVEVESEGKTHTRKVTPVAGR
jgi:S1-C subfamily serine protease